MAQKPFTQRPFKPDPEYDLIESRPMKRGTQCGKCGMKFDFNTAYGFCCPDYDCPVQPKVGGL